jgi:hypothetical protein
MRCAVDSFQVIKPRTVDRGSLAYTFCPGKATWYPWALLLVQDCLVAAETGILPREGSLQDQDALFVEVFPLFVRRWKERCYDRLWVDVRAFAKAILEAVFPKR